MGMPIYKDGNDMTAVVDGDSGEGTARSRELPSQITIPCIQGEMVYLRPASVGDLASMDALDAYVNASGVTGKDRVAERAAVQAWVRRSQAWVDGIESQKSGIGDPESRRTIAWAMLTVPEEHEDETVNEHTATEFIGMIFLIDIDGWARSARIQVILGKEYRGRGYSRDAMPRVMTYGFADEPEGLGLHRIWVAVPEKNTRSYSVYQSLGFVPSGTSRDALWDEANNKYQDLNVLDTLVDEYDPVRAMDAFGMHVITTNPGMEKALLLHQHSTAIRKQALSDTIASQPEAHSDEAQDETTMGDKMKSDSARIAQDNIESENTWPYNSTERNKSKKAWWRRLGHDRMSSRNANDSQQEE
ncbi:GNAT family acetyltransferase [Bifidobacterium animalis subsp. lactis ATCC 27673]|nr:GNAT family acetyltransferase [Bifidobacterium animalis subsp. lactis ATCC 27673]